MYSCYIATGLKNNVYKMISFKARDDSEALNKAISFLDEIYFIDME